MRNLPPLWLLLALMLWTVQAKAGDTAQPIAGLYARVQAQSAWQTQARQCPSTLMPARSKVLAVQANRCQSEEQLGPCMDRCEAGDGNDCYWLATALQQAGGPVTAYEPLYQRACGLGLVSACTNHAAGLLAADTNSEPARQCAVQTFAKACDLDDPWACTMYGFHLSRGIGVKADVNQALKALEKSCTFGPGDPACAGARQLQEEIRQAIQAARS